MKNPIKLLILAIVGSNLCFASTQHWDKDQTRRYVHNSELQLRSNWQFLSNILPIIKGNERVLDIGSGDGRMSSMLAALIKEGEIIGIEPNQYMLNWAQNQYCKEEYPNLRFQEGSYSTIIAEEEYKLITSFFSFHTLDIEKRDKAIAAIYKALKPSGRLVMTIPPSQEANPLFAKAISKTLFSDKWKRYFRERQANFKFETIEELSERFEKSPFEESSVKFRPSKDPFVGKADFVDWILGTMDFIQDVPEELRADLASDIIDQYSEFRPEAKVNETYFAAFGRIEVVAKKLYSSKVNSNIFGS